MPDVLVRGLNARVLKRLKAAARSHGRSLQAELHDVLHQASVHELAETRRLSDAWLARLGGRSFTDSAELIRADRDGR